MGMHDQGGVVHHQGVADQREVAERCRATCQGVAESPTHQGEEEAKRLAQREVAQRAIHRPGGQVLDQKLAMSFLYNNDRKGELTDSPFIVSRPLRDRDQLHRG